MGTGLLNQRVLSDTEKLAEHIYEVYKDTGNFYHRPYRLSPINLTLAEAQNNIPIYFEKPTDFEYKIPFNESMGTPHCDPQIEVISCGFTIISADKIEIHTELGINAGIYEKREISLVCDMEVDENKPITRDKQCAMVIYYAGENDTLWDIAHRFSASVSEILNINKMDDEDLYNGKMILVPLV